VILIEGPDGSGKSTLARYLAARFETEVLHEGGPPRTAEELQLRLFWQRANRGKILDRCPIVSERVYGPVVRGETRVSEEVLDEWTKLFVGDGWVLVYCNPGLGVLTRYAEDELARTLKDKLYKSRHHAEAVAQNLDRIVRAYDAAIVKVTGMGFPFLHYNRATDFPEKLGGDLEDLVRRVRRCAG
jgi:hypothetical protein